MQYKKWYTLEIYVKFQELTSLINAILKVVMLVIIS